MRRLPTYQKTGEPAKGLPLSGKLPAAVEQLERRLIEEALRES